MTYQELGKLYGGRIGDNSILCTDSHKSYMQFAIDMDLELEEISIEKACIIYNTLMPYIAI